MPVQTFDRIFLKHCQIHHSYQFRTTYFNIGFEGAPSYSLHTYIIEQSLNAFYTFRAVNRLCDQNKRGGGGVD
jgi:hypothetical protein